MRKIVKALDLEYIYEKFMSCNINLARQQFQKVENENWKAGLETKPKLPIYKKSKKRRNVSYLYK